MTSTDAQSASSAGSRTNLARLVAAAGGGCREAQDEIVRRFSPIVRSRVHRWLERDFRRRHGWMLAAFSTGDIVQVVFSDIVRRLGKFEFLGEAKLVGYLCTAAYREILGLIDYYTADCRDPAREEGAPGGVGAVESRRETPPAIAAGLREQLAIFREVLESFPDRRRLLIELRLVEKEPFAAIADKLNYASADSARQAFYDAHAKLLVELRARGMHLSGQTEPGESP